ncbi:hypothetical protein I3760_02G018500 [Carya illinoinensis]|uniref:uncharacterized protein LOC122297154 isoform X2 n=1 Tax=Carya illinoinensis TaxID=32201 RepID=UPI001BF7ED33|nr:uncharacterized protein LOC122297154 isoform X2 [Carya illinoinensis]KAG2720064.1 hypothetical protein I3760_02G018500 [Carya illinoinensis]
MIVGFLMVFAILFQGNKDIYMKTASSDCAISDHGAARPQHRPVDDHDATNGLVRSTRDLPPAHYTFQIRNCSLLFKNEVKKCESGQFEVGGYQWRLVVQLPTDGKKNIYRNHENDHISLYLAIANENNLLPGWEVNVNFKFFVFDQIRNNYLCVQDGIVRRFHNLKTEWGFAQLLSLDLLDDPSNGYIVDDMCVFGVEVFVLKLTGMGECLSMVKEYPTSHHFNWKIDKFDPVKDYSYHSHVFLVEGRKWRLKLNLRGIKSVEDAFLSLYLQFDASETLTLGRRLYANYRLQLRDEVKGNHLEETGERWFYDNVGFGFPSFLSLRDLMDTSKGYLRGDALSVQCRIEFIYVAKEFLPK